MLNDLESLLKYASAGVFNTMLNLQVEYEPIPENFFDGSLHMAGAVGFTGDFNGVIYLYCSHLFARKMTCALLGLTDADIENEEMVNDTLGELTNMVGGNVKSRLCDRGATCTMTIPAVVRGNDFRIESVSGALRQTVFFRCDGGRVLLEILIKHQDSNED